MELPDHLGFEPPDLSDKQELVCPDCKQFRLNPVVPPCGHQHCLNCAQHGKMCRACGAVLHSFQLLNLGRHMAMRHLYDAVLVRCRECHAMVSRGFDGNDWSAHEQQCPFLCICGKKVNRAELSHHCQTDCTHALVPCKAAPHCAWNQKRIQLAEHEQHCSIVSVLPALLHQQQTIDRLEEELAFTKNQFARQLDAQGEKVSKLAIDDQSIVDAGRHTYLTMLEMVKALDERLNEEHSALEKFKITAEIQPCWSSCKS